MYEPIIHRPLRFDHITDLWGVRRGHDVLRDDGTLSGAGTGKYGEDYRAAMTKGVSQRVADGIEGATIFALCTVVSWQGLRDVVELERK
jgi:hypothetical protein